MILWSWKSQDDRNFFWWEKYIIKVHYSISVNLINRRAVYLNLEWFEWSNMEAGILVSTVFSNLESIMKRKLGLSWLTQEGNDNEKIQVPDKLIKKMKESFPWSWKIKGIKTQRKSQCLLWRNERECIVTVQDIMLSLTSYPLIMLIKTK